MTMYNILMYKVSLNLLGNGIIDFTEVPLSAQEDIKPHSQMIININRSSKIHGNRSHSRAQKS